MKTKGLMPVIEKKDKAVSPIIATILLVAITVILASTLYLALTGFFTTSTSSTPTVGISAKNVTSGSVTFKYTVTITSPSSNSIAWSSTDWIVTIGSSTYTVPWVSAKIGWGTASGPTGSTTLNVSAPTGTYVGGGDVLTFTISYSSWATGSVISTLAFNLVGASGGQMGSTSL